MQRRNPLKYLYESFNRGDPLVKYQTLMDFPRMIDVEPTSSCNFRCLMCPTGNLSLKRPAEFMSDEVYSKIIEQSSNGLHAIRYIGWGEPTLHPHLSRYIEQAVKANLLTHVNTNGSHMDREYIKSLLGSGLHSIKFSFQGVDSVSYAEMRQNFFFDSLIENIAKVRQIRGHDEFPWISASTTITDESKERVEKFLIQISSLVDEVTIGHTTFDFMDLDESRLRPNQVESLKHFNDLQTVEKKHPDPCPEVFEKLSIHADGTARVCCNDFNGVTNLGNIKDTSISEMWRAPEMMMYRMRLSNKIYEGPLCSVCYDYHGLTEGEDDIRETVV